MCSTKLRKERINEYIIILGNVTSGQYFKYDYGKWGPAKNSEAFSSRIIICFLISYSSSGLNRIKLSFHLLNISYV